MSDDSPLVQAIAACREKEVKALVEDQLASGVSAGDILAQCNRGMVLLGNRFQSGECFLPELMMGGMIMKSVTELLGPHLAAGRQEGSAGKVVMGTVQYDVHDIGKDIVVMMLRGVGFEVVDLGVDVPPERFAQAVEEHQPQVLGMSVLLTTCYKSVTATVEALRQQGLRDGLGVMVGGAAASQLLIVGHWFVATASRPPRMRRLRPAAGPWPPTTGKPRLGTAKKTTLETGARQCVGMDAVGVGLRCCWVRRQPQARTGPGKCSIIRATTSGSWPGGRRSNMSSHCKTSTWKTSTSPVSIRRVAARFPRWIGDC